MAVIHNYPVTLRGKDTHRLADMAGVHFDLRSAAAMAAQLSRMIQTESRDAVILDALQAAALVRYARCFVNGVRRAFTVPKDWIDALTPDLRRAHRDFLNLRKRHIAHSVNDWELNVPVARVRVYEATGEIEVQQVTVDLARVLMLSSDTVDKLWNLAKTFADQLEQAMDAERLLEVAKKMPIEEIKRRIREDKPYFPGRRKIEKARGRP